MGYMALNRTTYLACNAEVSPGRLTLNVAGKKGHCW